ncbi:MAG: NADH-quinone oxidoreductase subunit M, partial [Candidatus Tectomicrobia bacterium]|nr:NADH-quinone oxidoreductase subunit M [Candidatus Tectomicrobia bacterium]
WGAAPGAERRRAAYAFLVYTVVGSLPMFLAILARLEYAGTVLGEWSAPWGLFRCRVESLLFFAFLLAFAVKLPVWPLHAWLPDAHTEAPTAGSVILAGVLLKMGGYGFLRFNLAMFPEASRYFVPLMVILGIVAIIYGALVCLAQGDMKRLIAFSSVSHMGFVILGMFVLNEQGLLGSLLYMINHGLSTGALFLIVGILYERRHTRMIADFGGLSKQLPVFAVFFAIAMLSSIGLPGLNGFIGEFLVVVGAFKSSMLYAILAVSGIILGAAYMLWLFQRTMFGTLDKEENRTLKDCNVREVFYMLPLVVFMFWIGLYPKPFLQVMEPSVRQLAARYQVAPVTPAAALQPPSGGGPGVVKEAPAGEPVGEQPSTREVGR